MNNQDLNWKFLKEIITILENEKIPIWLDMGTLLGFYRDKWFIPWDNDIDLGSIGEVIWKKRKIIRKKMKDKGYEITLTFRNLYIESNINQLEIGIHLFWGNDILIYNGGISFRQAPKNQFKKTYFILKKNICIYFINGLLTRYPIRSKIKKYNFFLKILMPLIKIISLITNRIFFLKWIATRKIHGEVGFQYKVYKKNIFSIKRINIKNYQLPIPLKTEQYLKNIYGNNWKTPIKNFDKTKDYKNV